MSIGVFCIRIHAKTDHLFVHCQVASYFVEGDFELVQLTMEDVKNSQGGTTELNFQRRKRRQRA